MKGKMLFEWIEGNCVLVVTKFLLCFCKVLSLNHKTRKKEFLSISKQKLCNLRDHHQQVSCTKLSNCEFSNCVPGVIKVERRGWVLRCAEVSEFQADHMVRWHTSLTKAAQWWPWWEHFHHRKKQTFKSVFLGELLVKHLWAHSWSRSDVTCIYWGCLCKI